MKKNESFLSEDLRFDLTSTFSSLEKYLKKGPKKLRERLYEWENRTQRGLDFYRKLLSGKLDLDSGFTSAKDLLEKKAKARYILRDFVLDKEADSYKFWLSQPELMRALFSMETILFNEVGGFDGRYGVERLDVTQIIINRTKIKEYSFIDEHDQIYPYLVKKNIKKINKYSWLNTLFKQGEFSFTYFFIPGNAKIYCPDMTRRGRYLRRDNLNIALNLIRKPNTSFDAVRYFSRASMLGRIDMSILWENFIPLAERVGPKVKRDRGLKKKYKKKDYTFLYGIKNKEGKQFKVISIKGKTYVVSLSGQFFRYRNPHYFKYFKTKPKAI